MISLSADRSVLPRSPLRLPAACASPYERLCIQTREYRRSYKCNSLYSIKRTRCHRREGGPSEPPTALVTARFRPPCRRRRLPRRRLRSGRRYCVTIPTSSRIRAVYTHVTQFDRDRSGDDFIHRGGVFVSLGRSAGIVISFLSHAAAAAIEIDRDFVSSADRRNDHTENRYKIN